MRNIVDYPHKKCIYTHINSHVALHKLIKQGRLKVPVAPAELLWVYFNQEWNKALWLHLGMTVINIKVLFTWCIIDDRLRYIPSNLIYTTHQLPKLKCFSYRLAVVLVKSVGARSSPCGQCVTVTMLPIIPTFDTERSQYINHRKPYIRQILIA